VQHAPQQDAAGERALAAHTAHHQAMAREVEQAQQEAALALRRSSEVEQALAASQAVSAETVVGCQARLRRCAVCTCCVCQGLLSAVLIAAFSHSHCP